MRLRREAIHSFISRSSGWSLTLALIVSASMNVVLSQRLRALTVRDDSADTLVGSYAPPIAGTSVAGAPLSISYADKPTIVYYFSPSCAWCDRNWSNVKALQEATAGRYRFVGVSALPQVKSYATKHRLSFDIYTNVPDSVRTGFHFGPTPHTIVVSTSGQIVKSWLGAYSAPILADMSAYFKVQMPRGPQPSRP